MTFVANLIETRAGAWVLIVLTLLLGGGSVLLAGQVEQDDDLTASMSALDLAMWRGLVVAQRMSSRLSS